MRFERTAIALLLFSCLQAGLLTAQTCARTPAAGTDGPAIGSRSFEGHECTFKQNGGAEQAHWWRSCR